MVSAARVHDAHVDVPAPADLIDRIRALPSGAPLLAAVGEETGVYLVGGAVRDLLLASAGRPASGPSGDLDLVAEGDVEALAARLGGADVSHERFGTATVTLDGRSYDLAMARRETYPQPGALPDVTPATLGEDLGRRDFTVNAIAVALGGPRAGEVTAFPGALEDLSAERLRVLHDRSFLDDPTRLFRLVRYASRLGFTIDPTTRALARAAVEAGAVGTMSGSRLGAELRLLAEEGDPVAALAAMGDLGIDRALEPSLAIVDEELGRRAMGLLPADGRCDVLALALATLEIPRSELGALLDELAFDADTRDAVLAAAAGARPTAAALAAATRPSEIAAAVAGGRPELVALAGALGSEAPAREWLERLRHVRLEIDGADLLASGIGEGPAVGRGLRAALAAKLDGRVDDRAGELAEALRAAR